jgi:CdiI immunity protein
MKELTPSDFPELQRVFAGYLHEDFLEEYGTPVAALRAFQDDADHSERQRFLAETRRFLERTARLDFNEVRALMARLGCRWTPTSRKALVALLAEATHPPLDKSET